MKHNFSSSFKHTIRKRGMRYFLPLLTVPVLAACSVDSTTVDDSDLLANFFVQNDNGNATALVTLTTEDLNGSNDVTLVRREAIFFEHNGLTVELNEEDDGEYEADLPANASGPVTFTIERVTTTTPPRLFDIDENRTFLPDTFQELVAEPVQTGQVLDLSWRVDNTQQIIDGFAVPAAVESFNALANCLTPDDDTPFDIAITEGLITQQDGRQFLQIAVTEHLTGVLNLSAEITAATSCEFDVQLVRDITGTTDTDLDSRSTASGQTLMNVAVQWAAQ